MWRLPCRISIESTMKWLPQHVECERLFCVKSPRRWPDLHESSPVPGRSGTSRQRGSPNPGPRPSWLDLDRFTRQFASGSSMDFANLPQKKLARVLKSSCPIKFCRFFFDIFSLLGFPPFTAARWALWEWRIARRVVSAWTRPATCDIAVALFMRKNIMFNTKNHRSSNIMIDPQLLSIGTFDQKADLPLPRSSSPKKMEERSKSLNALSRIHLYRRSWARCTQRSFACRWIHCRLWPLPTWHSNTDETLEGINQSTNQPSLNLRGSEVNTKFPAFAPFADVRYLHHIISSKMPVLSLMLVLSIKPATGRQSGPSSFVGNFLTFSWHQQVL